ncbi:MAG: hypothetical protein J6C17_00745, partial [Clostridia bacterium]|nr:hypothetical protein [Clostridia bacterium]
QCKYKPCNRILAQRSPRNNSRSRCSISQPCRSIIYDEKTIEELNGEIEELREENKTLRKEKEETVVGPQDAVQYQILLDLSEIWGKYKNGEIENAKKSFEKISTSGFDDTALSFYESLREILNKGE